MSLEVHSFSGSSPFAALLGDVTLGNITEPFPEWYIPGMKQSMSPLAPDFKPVALATVNSTAQAIDYAAGSWKAAAAATGVKDSTMHKKALARYRFVHDLVRWAEVPPGLAGDQISRFLAHARTKIKSGDQALRAALAAPTALTKEPAVAAGPKLPELPATAPVAQAGMLGNIWLWAGAGILLYALSR